MAFIILQFETINLEISGKGASLVLHPDLTLSALPTFFFKSLAYQLHFDDVFLL